MVECKVLKKYKDASLDSKTLEKGTIVEYELEKAEKLQKSGYVKIVGDVTPITHEEELEEPEEDKELETTNDEEESEETTEEDKELESANDGESEEPAEEDKESDDKNEIEMATMPKKYKKKK